MTGFSLLGRELRARGLPAPLEGWLREHWHFPEHELPAVPFVVELEPGAPPAGDLPAAGPPLRVPGAELPCRLVGEDAWELGDAAGGARLRLHSGGARIEWWEEGGSARMPLFVAVYDAMRSSGLMPLHASVLERDGVGMALVAASGTGKSSTLLSLATRGWNPVAEDFAWLEPESLRVFGWDRGLHLWPAGLDRFPDAPEGWTPARDGKLFLPWSALPPPTARQARLETMAALERDASRATGWEPLPDRDAVRALWEAIGLPLSAASRDAVARVIPGLLRRVAFRRLVLGDTPLEL